MQSATRLTSAAKFFLTVTVLFGWLLVLASPANAQTGEDAVYPSSGTCCQASSAFIDASMYAGSVSSPNFCSVLNYVLVNVVQRTYPGGAVIDARGLPGTTGTSMTCTGTPWYNGTTYVSAPSTILLPAGTIIIPATWVLPSNTHLIGEGDADPSGGTPGTTIQAASGSSLATMIQFGSSSVCPLVNNVPICTGISVENLTLNGQAQSVDGIINQFAQNNSYVNHVCIYQVLGTGLLVSSSGSSSAANSGPYSNITFDTGGYSGTSGTVCAQILNVGGGTLGIHGLYCYSETNDAPAAVLLDSSNNSIKDVTIVGFYDGIRVGANGNAQNNVLLNILGHTSRGTATPVNTVHIPSSNYTVTDLSIMGASNSALAGTTTITDALTNTTISDSYVAMYALGEQASGGYSRFTTSPHAATWASGTSVPSSNCTSNAGGSLFSNTSGSGYALWVCPAGGGAWKGIL